MTNDLVLRTATEADYPELEAHIHRAFLDDVDEDTADLNRKVFEPGRTQLMTDDGRIVGSGLVITRDLSVPGGVVPAAHVTGVGVASTHRRRGVLTALMNAMLTEAHGRGTEPLAVLWASEGAIYGRYGYGLASWRVSYEIATRDTSVVGTAPDGARLRQVATRDVLDEIVAVYDRVLTERPGLSTRPGQWWEYLTADPKGWRRGMSAERTVLYEDAGGVRGYARFRTKAGWGNSGPDGEVRVTELLAETPEAHAALWRFLTSIDLVRTVKYMHGPIDDPLPHLVTNPDALVGSAGGSLWVRILDVPGALAVRRYAAPVDVVLEVTDTAFTGNTGRWRLVADDDKVDVSRTDADGDVALDVRALGSLYLGGVSAGTLAAGGLISERAPGAVARLSAAFGWHRVPVSVEVF
ncbi:GNAT family N-acetyltransferase [Jiangella rhizosphaerae]|uniref:GNAT family N-acetyltransferase n=1 Tax=Jiangella rhizosphaerae TaxID=2293569 RepID=A0A418KVI4_9ACTN|nr:GNAT family N-acetyltransferase [Jiangella rhizosphaerae]RIQ33623.1 GNAT family N-acetyltransferase [Jiangella rhizosphaerae]